MRIAISRTAVANAGTPEALVKRILQHETDPPVPLTTEALCERFGIVRIANLDADGFERRLVTDPMCLDGVILMKRGAIRIAPFTFAREVGRFLMAHHDPDEAEQFLCKSSDLLRLTA